MALGGLGHVINLRGPTIQAQRTDFCPMEVQHQQQGSLACSVGRFD